MGKLGLSANKTCPGGTRLKSESDVIMLWLIDAC